MYLLLVVKVEFLAISFLIIYVGAVAVLIIFGLMVLGVSARSVSRRYSVWFYLGLVNTLLLVFGAQRSIFLILSERRSLISVLVPTSPNSTFGWLWVQDVSILGVSLYGPNFKYF